MVEAIATRELEIERLAFRDPLTDLPNRTFLLKTTSAFLSGQADSNPAKAFLMLFDLARLKAINETLGFATGDTKVNKLSKDKDRTL